MGKHDWGHEGVFAEERVRLEAMDEKEEEKEGAEGRCNREGDARNSTRKAVYMEVIVASGASREGRCLVVMKEMGSSQ